MRVLAVGNMYPPHSFGGYEVAWRGAMNHLRRRGHRVDVLTTDFRLAAPDPGIGEDPDVHRTLRWYWRDHAFPRLGAIERLRIERHNRAELRRRLHELDPDAVSWWSMGAMSLSMIELVRRGGLPASGVVADDWMDYGLRTDAWQRAFARRPWLPRRPVELATRIPIGVDIAGAAEWIFISPTVLRRAEAAGWRFPRRRIAPLGIDADLFTPALEHDWGWRLLYVGRIDPRKGIEVAIEALAELPQARLRVIGGGDEAVVDALSRRAAELGVAPRLELARVRRDELAAEYAAADVVLFPSQWEEPQGLVPLEAMGCGRPVVATGVGGSGEYLRDSENCLLFSPRDDAAALAEAVRRLAGDPKLRAGIRAAGLETAGRHTEDAFNRAVEDSLLSVAGA